MTQFPITELLIRAKDELELADEDLTNEDEFDVWLGDMFSNIERSKSSADGGGSFEQRALPHIPCPISFTETLIGDVHISLASAVEDVFVTDLLLIEMDEEASKGEGDKVEGSKGFPDFAFISSAASALEMFSCFFHFVRRFWNQIFTYINNIIGTIKLLMPRR